MNVGIGFLGILIIVLLIAGLVALFHRGGKTGHWLIGILMGIPLLFIAMHFVGINIIPLATGGVGPVRKVFVSPLLPILLLSALLVLGFIKSGRTGRYWIVGSLIGVEMKDLTPRNAPEKTAQIIELLHKSHYPGLSWMMSDCLAWYF